MKAQLYPFHSQSWKLGGAFKPGDQLAPPYSVDVLCEPKVDELEVPRPVNYDVLRLEVPVHKAAGVQTLQRQQHLRVGRSGPPSRQ